MDSDFVNAYIEKVTNEVTELVKTKLLLETQLLMAQKTVNELQSKIEMLELNSKPAKEKKDS